MDLLEIFVSITTLEKKYNDINRLLHKKADTILKSLKAEKHSSQEEKNFALHSANTELKRLNEHLEKLIKYLK